MKKGWLSGLAFVLATAGGTVNGGEETFPCIVTASQTVEVGSPVTGLLASVLVERSDSVEKGQVVARLAAEVERRSVDLAALRTEDASDVQAAIASREFAKREQNRMLLLYRKALVSKQALDKAVTELELAEKRLEQARAHAAQTREELAVARAQLDRRVIRSPIDGIVAERYVSEGQRVRDEPIVRIIKVDPLHVEAVVPAKWFGKIKKGDRLTVSPELPGIGTQQGKVVIIDKIMDAASNTFRITLELDNRDHRIPAGARCGVKAPTESP